MVTRRRRVAGWPRREWSPDWHWSRQPCAPRRPGPRSPRERAGTLDAELVEGLYAAGTETALDLLREVDDAITSVLVVGHNPTMASLAAVLDDGEGDEQAGNELALGYPTAAVTVFSYDGAWTDLDEASASVVAYHVGRA